MACVGGVDGVGRVFAAAVGHVGAVETAGTLPPYLLGRPLSHSIGFVLAKTKVVPAFCGKSVRILARSPAQVPRPCTGKPSIKTTWRGSDRVEQGKNGEQQNDSTGIGCPCRLCVSTAAISTSSPSASSASLAGGRRRESHSAAIPLFM